MLALEPADPATPASADAVAAVSTNAPAATNASASASAITTAQADALLRSIVLMQEQLHTTEREVQQAREEAATASRRTAELLNERLNFLEGRQLEAMQNSSRLTLMIVGLIAGIACVAVILTGWLQSRAVTRLSQISRQLDLLPALAVPAVHRQIAAGDPLPPTAAVLSATETLSGSMDRLKKRVDELEHTANGSGPQPLAPQNGSASNARIATIVAKGQTLLNMDHPEEALACFDEAIALDARSIEAWIKKGTAFERLQRIDDALAAYDKAIEADESTATAYLFKAGVFNRQKRYAEALQCYERALQVQRSRTVAAA